MKPAVYILFSDITKPRRLFVMREDVHGLVHFVNDESSDSALAVPWCYAETTAKLVIFFRGQTEFFMPTCLWCVNEPYKKSRRP